MSFIKRLLRIDYKRMFNTIRLISKRSNKSFFFITFDIIRCYLKYGSGYIDYFLFFFEGLSDDRKATFINRSVNESYIRKLNNPEYYHVFSNKPEFLKTFKDYIVRDWLYLKESSYSDFEKFCKKHSKFIVKPDDGMCGIGVSIIDSNGKDIKTIYDDLIKNNILLVEELLIQDDSISNVYPHSINTIRVYTINLNDEVHVMFKAIRIGNHGKVVDNFNNGGMFSVIDDDGVIRKPAIDKLNNIFDKHPMTGTDIVGFRIPRFNEIIELCKKLALVVPEIRYAAWDIAVTKTGLDIVEGNEHPGYDIYQSRPHLNPNDIHGLKPYFDSVINSK